MLPSSGESKTELPRETEGTAISSAAVTTPGPTPAQAALPSEPPAPTGIPVPDPEPFLQMDDEPGRKDYLVYREITPQEGVAVYINEKKMKPEYDDLSEEFRRRAASKPEVIIQAGGYQYVLEKEYFLECGEPVVTIKKGCYAGLECEEILSVVLPVKELPDALSPIGSAEVYGREYVLDIRSLAEGKKVEALEIIPGENTELSAGYRLNQKGEKVFALSVPRWSESSREYWREGIFWYPGLDLPEQEHYSLVYEELSHFTDSGIGYRRVGIAAGNQMIFLGKFCNDIFFPDTEIGYYDEYWEFDLEGGPDLQPWQPRPLEPETLLDLDGDGVPEKISYRMTGERMGSSRFIVSINGVENVLDDFRTDVFFGNCMFTASLDGKTKQLMVFHLGDGASREITVYSYKNGCLQRAGQIENADSYRISEEDGIGVFAMFCRISPLQSDMTLMKYSLTDGMLREIPQEYYKFCENRMEENGTPARNILTLLQDFELHTEKGGDSTFVLPKGSHVTTLGGDLADWIHLQRRHGN